MPHSIEAVELTKRFAVQKSFSDLLLRPFEKRRATAYENINLAVNHGELFCLLGPNGAGKTTFIKTLSTLILPTSGRAFVNGIDLALDAERVRRHIGLVVSDERSFYWRLSGRQNLKFFSVLNNLPSKLARERIDQVLRMTGLDEHADRAFRTYSAGMKQKLAVARGLLTNPDVLFMDEPARSLDPTAAENLRQFIRGVVVDRQGKTVFLATHNLDEAERLADRVAIIHRGRLRAAGTIPQIREKLGLRPRYIMDLAKPTSRTLAEFRNPELMEHLRIRPVQSNGTVFSIEVEVLNGRVTISDVIEKVVVSGGRVITCRPMDRSLMELFSHLTKWDN